MESQAARRLQGDLRPFKDGKPSGAPQDVLTGFLNDKGEAQGRPVGVRSTSRARCWSPTTSATRLARHAGGEIGGAVVSFLMVRSASCASRTMRPGCRLLPSFETRAMRAPQDEGRCA